MICPNCGCFFCDDNADQIFIGGVPKKFCTTSCAKRYSAKKTGLKWRAKQRKKGHEIGKRHFPSQEVAETYLADMPDRKYFPDAGAYWCCEKGWCVTRNLISEENRKQPKGGWTAKGSVQLSNPVLPENFELPK